MVISRVRQLCQVTELPLLVSRQLGKGLESWTPIFFSHISPTWSGTRLASWATPKAPTTSSPRACLLRGFFVSIAYAYFHASKDRLCPCPLIARFVKATMSSPAIGDVKPWVFWALLRAPQTASPAHCAVPSLEPLQVFSLGLRALLLLALPAQF